MASPEKAPKLSAQPDVADAIRRVLSGEKEAFAIIVKAFQKRLYNLNLALLGNPSTADDLTQTAFTRAFKYLKSFDCSRPFYPWLATIATRNVQGYIAGQRIPELPLTSSYDQSAKAEHPLTGLIRDEKARELWQSVLELPAAERAAAILFYRQELSVRQTAEVLGVTTGTVKTLLFRARRHLLEGLSENQRRKS